MVTLFAMMGAGVILAVGYFVEFSTVVILSSLAVAILGLAVFFVVGFRQARQSGQTFLRSVGKTLRGILRLAFDLF